jgi:hypothetical protein
VSLLTGLIKIEALTHIHLLHKMARIIMGITVSFPSPQPGCPWIMGILQMDWNRLNGMRFNMMQGLCNGLISRIALRRRSHVQGGLGQRNLAFGHSHSLQGMERGHSDLECRWIGITHIFGCTDDQSPDNIKWVLARMQHLGQPIKGRIGVRAPHALNKCRNGVIVGLFLIDQGFLPYSLLGDLEVKIDLASSIVGRSGEYSQLQGI